MKILNPIETQMVNGGVNNPGHHDLNIAFKEGLLSGLVGVTPLAIIAACYMSPVSVIAYAAAITIGLAGLVSVGLAYFDIPVGGYIFDIPVGGYIFYPNGA